LITEACNRISQRFRRKKRSRGQKPRQGPQGPTPTEQATITATQWASQRWKTGEKKGKELKTDEVVELAWQARWESQRDGRLVERLADGDPPTLLFTDKALKQHEGFTKAQSTLLSQARIEVIGLRDYLFKVKVPEVRTPYCRCGEGRETVEHLVVWCSDPPLQRPWDRREIRSRRDLQAALQVASARSGRLVKKVLGWLMDSGRLLEYRLARRLELETGEEG
jgi:hypothetical protein